MGENKHRHKRVRSMYSQHREQCLDVEIANDQYTSGEGGTPNMGTLSKGIISNGISSNGVSTAWWFTFAMVTRMPLLATAWVRGVRKS